MGLTFVSILCNRVWLFWIMKYMTFSVEFWNHYSCQLESNWSQTLLDKRVLLLVNHSHNLWCRYAGNWCLFFWSYLPIFGFLDERIQKRSTKWISPMPDPRVYIEYCNFKPSFFGASRANFNFSRLWEIERRSFWRILKFFPRWLGSGCLSFFKYSQLTYNDTIIAVERF